MGERPAGHRLSVIEGDIPLADIIVAQRQMPDGTVAEVYPLIMGTGRIGIGRDVGGYTYRGTY